jgi:predicted dehydrogenase
MIDAAIVGLGRWGRTLVEAVQGRSDRLRFTHAVSRNPDKLGDFAGRHRLALVGELEAVLDGAPSTRSCSRRRIRCIADKSSL